MITSINFVTARELDPFTASALNVRFFGFLTRLADELGEDRERVRVYARDILRDAEIPQPGDELLQGPAPDLSAFK